MLFLDQETRSPSILAKCAGADEIGGNAQVLIAVNMARQDVSSPPMDKWPKKTKCTDAEKRSFVGGDYIGENAADLPFSKWSDAKEERVNVAEYCRQSECRGWP